MKKYLRRTSLETAPDCDAGLFERLLRARGIASPEERDAFLLAGEESLHSPTLLSDMARAKDRILAAVRAREPICIWGDYDVDGVCASAILFGHLRAMGANAQVYLPSRHLEGYGLNSAGLQKASAWARLLITVDCGISALESVEYAKSLGMDVIVTDHHRPGDALPDCPVVNPLLNEYPCPSLSGAGVAFKLVEALRGREAAMESVDLAALATVADVVPLLGENRAIVRMGLMRMNARPRPGIQALREAAGLGERELTAGHLGFQIGPRLNAAGRLGSARRALDLLLSHDPEQAQTLAEELDAENTRRREVEKEIVDNTLEQLRDFDFPAHRALVLAGKDWNPGVLGLAAARLVEKFHYPTILLSGEEALTGSCRSIEGVDIFQALSAVSAFLERFGGHRQAAGLTIRREHLPAFVQALDEFLWQSIPPEAYVPVAPYDLECSLDELTEPEVSRLEQFQPCGMGNPAPVLRAPLRVTASRRVGRDGAHLKLSFEDHSRKMDGVFFQMGPHCEEFVGECDALFTPKLNAFQGRVRVELELKALEPLNAKARILANWGEEPSLMSHFLTEMLYNRNIYSPALPPNAEGLLEALEKSPQGTLAVSWDFSGALAFLEKARVPLDVYLGHYPEDPRAFNALCILPTGAPARNYRLVALTDRPKWLRELPDVDGLRELYKALSPAESGLDSLAARVGIGEIPCLAGLMALADMDLIELRAETVPVRYRKKLPKKVDPAKSRIFQMLQSFKKLP